MWVDNADDKDIFAKSESLLFSPHLLKQALKDNAWALLVIILAPWEAPIDGLSSSIKVFVRFLTESNR